MKYKQIADILNATYGELIGETAVIAEDLSNVVEIGKTITSNSTFGDDFDRYTRSLVDHVGKVIFRENQLGLSHLPIYKDSWEFGSIAEKVRVDYPEVQDDYSFDLNNYTGDDVFELVIPRASAKFFNNSTTFQIKVSLPTRQAKSAFNSAREMSQFISLIENTIKQRLAISLLTLEYRTLSNLIAEKFKANKSGCLIDLLALYKSETGDTAMTKAKFLQNEECLRFANLKIGMMRDLINKPSKLYGEGDYVNVSAPSEQTLVVLTDYDRALGSYLYSVNRHNEFIKLDNYSVVPYWQAGGNNDSYASRSSINVIPASEGSYSGDPEEDTRTPIVQTDILAVLFDYRACAVTCEHQEVTSIQVPDARMTNYWFFADANYINDTDENVIVFYLGGN